jgi:hypothetical protein
MDFCPLSLENQWILQLWEKKNIEIRSKCTELTTSIDPSAATPKIHPADPPENPGHLKLYIKHAVVKSI